jgi:hypothetical protein
MPASGDGAPAAAAAQQCAGGTGAVADFGGDTPAASASGPGGQHYEEVAASYEAAFFYSSPEYRAWVMERVLRHFGLPDEVGHPTDSTWRVSAALPPPLAAVDRKSRCSHFRKCPATAYSSHLDAHLRPLFTIACRMPL